MRKKQKLKSIVATLALCVTLVGCGAADSDDKKTEDTQNDVETASGDDAVKDDGTDSSSADVVSTPENAITEVFTLVDGAETGNLVLADDNTVYTLTVGDIPVYLDDERADAGAIQDGMPVYVEYDGERLESYPLQFGNVYKISVYSLGNEKNPAGTTYDICGLYLKVFEDLWSRNEGLNEGITKISVDLSSAPGDLTEGEKQAIAWVFAGNHNCEVLTLTHDELVEQNICEPMNWEDGELFYITGNEVYAGDETLPPNFWFDAVKWRSGEGEYYFADCYVLWPECGTWTDYDIAGESGS